MGKLTNRVCAALVATGGFWAEEARAAEWAAAPRREGAAIARGAHDEALYVADEDAGVLRVVPLDADAEPYAIELPGPPANVLAMSDRVLVTVRDPSRLVTFALVGGGEIAVASEIPLPADAWGLALSEDESTAFVTSAFSDSVSGVDLATGSVRFSVATPREPRGVIALADRLYVTHLVGASLTRIDDLESTDPLVTPVDVAPGRFTAPHQGLHDSFPLDASLAWAPVPSPSGDRLYVARHSLAAHGRKPWRGRPTVDVLLTENDEQLAPQRDGPDVPSSSGDGTVIQVTQHAFVQPRGVAFRARTRSLLVASEGFGELVELDARGLDPALFALRRIALSRSAGGEPKLPALEAPGPRDCGAPSGVALSADESTAWVWCRTTHDLATVDLERGDVTLARLGPAPSDAPAEVGRRLYFDATDRSVSGGLACSGCHPDGRDDGHVWTELSNDVLSASPAPFGEKRPRRQTPFLAGKVLAESRFGWRGESHTLEERIRLGFTLHRWDHDRTRSEMRRVPALARALAAYLANGLRPPPRTARPLTPLEEEGRDVFASNAAGCAGCHIPSLDFTDGGAHELGLGGDEASMKTPSLLYVGRTAPYAHDGGYSSLDDLLTRANAMGTPGALGRAERAALASYLSTIGVVQEGAVDEPLVHLTLDPPRAAPPRDPVPLEFECRPRHSCSGEFVPSAPWSPEPTNAEWGRAKETRLPTRVHLCQTSRVREWVRVRCLAGWGSYDASVVAGTPGARAGSDDESPQVILPVRLGDRRLVAFTRGLWADDYAPKDERTRVLIDESWLPGEPEPTLLVQEVL